MYLSAVAVENIQLYSSEWLVGTGVELDALLVKKKYTLPLLVPAE